MRAAGRASSLPGLRQGVIERDDARGARTVLGLPVHHLKPPGVEARRDLQVRMSGVPERGHPPDAGVDIEALRETEGRGRRPQ